MLRRAVLFLACLWSLSAAAAPPRTGDDGRGPGFRFGVGAGPAVHVALRPADIAGTAYPGIVVPLRLGYQFRYPVGLYAEPFAFLGFRGGALDVSFGGALVLQMNAGRHFRFAVGPSVSAIYLCPDCEPLPRTGGLFGGFVTRLGLDILVRTRPSDGHAHALSLDLDVRPSFGPAGGAFLLVGAVLGYDSY